MNDRDRDRLYDLLMDFVQDGVRWDDLRVEVAKSFIDATREHGDRERTKAAKEFDR